MRFLYIGIKYLFSTLKQIRHQSKERVMSGIILSLLSICN